MVAVVTRAAVTGETVETAAAATGETVETVVTRAVVTGETVETAAAVTWINVQVYYRYHPFLSKPQKVRSSEHVNNIFNLQHLY